MAISNPRKLVYAYNKVFGVVGDNYWVELPTPSEYAGSATTVVDSARNSKGQVVGQVVKSDIAKIELKWNFLTVAQYSKIAKLFEYNLNGNKFFLPVSFFDVVKGEFEGLLTKAPNDSDNICRLFYPSDRKVSFAKIKLDSNGCPIGYTDVALNLIDAGVNTAEDVIEW